MIKRLAGVYEWLILKHSIIALVIISALTLWVGSFGLQFKFDASAESLLLKNDPNLKYYRSIKSKYGSDEYLVLIYSSQHDAFSSVVLNDLAKIKKEISEINGVKHTTSLLDIPLVKSPQVTFENLATEIRTLEQGNADLALAKSEIMTSPIYRGLILSQDGKKTAMLINLSIDNEYDKLILAQDHLQQLMLNRALTEIEQHQFDKISSKIQIKQELYLEKQNKIITQIRNVMALHSQNAELFLGGIPMITVDSIRYIKHDFYIFGSLAILGIIAMLITLFRETRWVVAPVLTCLFSGIFVVGVLGLLGWPVTVVSANFPPLLLILTFSLIIHLIVAFRELESTSNKQNTNQLILQTIKSKITPSFFTAATTMVGFCSLLASDIQPLIDFGLILAIGIIISFCFAFTFFPALITLFKQKQNIMTSNKITLKFMQVVTKFVENYPKLIMLIFLMVSAIIIFGMIFLNVQNRFIDYYKPSTEIYRGMEIIDKQFGGTTPLDIIIDAPRHYSQKPEQMGIAFSSYWFNPEKLSDITKIHLYLETLPHVGKVLSIATSMAILESIDAKATLDKSFMSLLYEKIPYKLKSELFKPYLSEDGNQLRLSIRVFESDADLDREKLIETIKSNLVTQFNIEPSQIHLTGMVVLYNNMLQSFYKSQILTLFFVFSVIFIMFFVIFKNLIVALICIIPNLLAGLFVLGFMGWVGIPLDLMTITIAAISIGIAVDDTIHYVHRYTQEFRKQNDYFQSFLISHRTVGLAMVYTTLIITFGFIILTSSNFVPTIYFGLLTSCAMFIALVADLTLLPVLIFQLKPRIK